MPTVTGQLHVVPRALSRVPGMGGLLWRADDSGGRCWITFDDGPDPDGTPAVLEALERHGATATFFLLVERARRHPALVRAVTGEGHAVGLHGVDHRRLDRVPVAELAVELSGAAAELADMAGHDVVLWRPPFGRLSWRGLRAARRAGLRPVLWSHDPQDWSPEGSDDLAERIHECLQPGAVVLLHDGADTFPGQGRRTAAALEDALARRPALLVAPPSPPRR